MACCCSIGTRQSHTPPPLSVFVFFLSCSCGPSLSLVGAPGTAGSRPATLSLRGAHGLESISPILVVSTIVALGFPRSPTLPGFTKGIHRRFAIADQRHQLLERFPTHGHVRHRGRTHSLRASSGARGVSRSRETLVGSGRFHQSKPLPSGGLPSVLSLMLLHGRWSTVFVRTTIGNEAAVASRLQSYITAGHSSRVGHRVRL